jgi:hypothetical protein
MRRLAIERPALSSPAASAVPVVELSVVQAPRCAAIGELSLSNAAEDGIELAIADVEG